MIAISSARKHELNADYAKNQKRAAASWRPIFEKIFYFNEYEEDLNGPNTLFVRSGDFPTIKDMAQFAAWQQGDDYIALINADIVVTRELLSVEARMKAMSLPAATSYRYEFQGDDIETCSRSKEDRGMDIFICQPEIWKLIAKEIPEYLRFGHQTWDSWMCGWLCSNLGYGFRQFTDYMAIRHPKHEGRMTPHAAEIRNDSKYFTLAKRPSPLSDVV